MKTKYFALVTVLVILLVQSCIPSIQPLYTEKDLIFVEDLLGTWGENNEENDNGNKLMLTSGDGETWYFQKWGEKAYHLTHTDDDGEVGMFDVRILKLDKYYFMDFYPTTENVKEEPTGPDGSIGDVINFTGNSFQAYHYLPVHTFAKLEVSKENLVIRLFDPDFLEELLKNKQIRIKHEKVEDGFVLTASPEELQKFVTKYAEEDKAFVDAMNLKRKF